MKAIGVVFLLAISAVPRPSLSADASASGQPTVSNAAATWTAERVRDFILGVEREVDKLQKLRLRSDGDLLSNEDACRNISAVMPRLKAMLGPKVLGCYTATYLGCAFGEWKGSGMESERGPVTVPFTLSKVTILEQTPGKVIADVVEASDEIVYDGVAKYSDGDGYTRPLTEKELSGYYQATSRYTLTRGKDGVWRISDRKPPWAWQCPSVK